MAVIDKSTLPPQVLDVLRALRRRIKRYVALEGAALVLVVLGVAFWFSLAGDYWFEHSLGVRRVLLLAAIGAVMAVGVWYLLLRLVRVIRNRALALVLERRFPQLGDRLITSVELLEAGSAEPLTSAMLQQTAAEAAQLSEKLPLREVFNLAPLLKATFAALGLVLSMGAFAWANSEVFHTWFRRNFLLADDQYRRDTDLDVVVLADPGERIVEFRNGVYKHPRGADFTFLATVPDEKKVPDQVQFSYRNTEHSGGGGDYMTRIGGRQFRQRLIGLHEGIRLWLSGGDFSTRTPFVVEVVEPPQIDRVVLHVLYPEYTGLNSRDEPSLAPVRQEITVQGTQVSLPAGTDLIIEARTNKPLTAVRMQTDAWELRLTRAGAQLALPTEGAGPLTWIDLPSSESLLAADGRSFRVPCLLSATPVLEVVSASGQPHLPLRLAADSLLRVTLHDDDDVMSAEPVRLTINSIADEPPQIETRLKGIGTSITRQATIPVVGEIQDVQDGSKRYGVTDDYGIAEARFEYKLENTRTESKENGYQPAPFASRPEGRKQFPVDEKFAVLSLDLTVGVKLTLKIVAADADVLTGPHLASGQPYNFQVVSDDELLALIAVKELNLRRRFEQILDEVKDTRKDLLLGRTRLDEVRELRNQIPAGRENEVREQLAALDLALSTSVERAINGIRKNANETQSIEEEFRDIRDELENNAVPDVRSMLDRIDDGIVRPLHSVNTHDYNDVDDALMLLRKALEDREGVLSRFEEPVDRLNLTVEHLEAVLAQMLKLESFNEALQLLRDIIKTQEDLQEKTRQERKKKLIEGLQ
ncbi:MAG: hypothetical protein EXS05_00480 [Planctomycetaceae bacterium]|nr:hypothetical protein [Planctomycetaceae bacterium]